MFKKYNVIEFFLNDLNDLNTKNIMRINALSELGANKDWCENFIQFINNVLNVCASRLGYK